MLFSDRDAETNFTWMHILTRLAGLFRRMNCTSVLRVKQACTIRATRSLSWPRSGLCFHSVPLAHLTILTLGLWAFYLISHRLLLFVLSLNSWFSLLSVFDFNVWFSPSNSLYNAKWCHSLLTLCWLKNGKYPFLTAFSLFQYVLYSYNFSGAIRVESFSTAVMQATKNSFPVKELKIKLICWLIYWWWNIKNI